MANYDYEYYEEEPVNQNRFIMLPAGMIVGFALGPLYFSHPDVFSRAWGWLHDTILTYMPDNPDYVTYVMIGLVVVAAILLRGILRKFWMLSGLALGIALWIPMGAHAVYYMPPVKTFFPQAEPNLTLIVAKNQQFTTARNWAVETFPLAPQDIPSLADALAAATPAAGTETSE